MRNNIIIKFEECFWNFKNITQLKDEEEYIFQKPSSDNLFDLICTFYYPSKEIIIEEVPKMIGETKPRFDGKISTFSDLNIINRMIN